MHWTKAVQYSSEKLPIIFFDILSWTDYRYQGVQKSFKMW
jgi:hypothetical protein